MNSIDLTSWQTYVAGLDFKPLFVTVSGSHIYGFNSQDSDVDLRGCHNLPLDKIVGLNSPTETIDRASVEDGVEVDIVSHEIGKYLRLLVKNNGYVLEQIYSPLVISGDAFLGSLRQLAAKCITRFHYHHYRGFFATKLKLLDKEPTKKAKSLLYAYRVLLTGTHLMKTGRVVTNILELHDEAKLDFIPDLIAQKVEEKIALPNLDWDFHRNQLLIMSDKMEVAFEESELPAYRDEDAVNEFLVDFRLRDL
jgi:predicted nucleotidyltransferase